MKNKYNIQYKTLFQFTFLFIYFFLLLSRIYMCIQIRMTKKTFSSWSISPIAEVKTVVSKTGLRQTRCQFTPPWWNSHSLPLWISMRTRTSKRRSIEGPVSWGKRNTCLGTRFSSATFGRCWRRESRCGWRVRVESTELPIFNVHQKACSFNYTSSG